MKCPSLLSVGVGSLLLLGLCNQAYGVDFQIQTDAHYRDATNLMQEVVRQYPAHAKLVEVGTSDSGSPLWAIQIGEGPVHNLVVSTHHGNEYGSAEVAKALLVSLAEAPIVGQTVFVVPVLNITGYDSRDRYEPASNGQSYDPNRNYPSPCGGEGPFTLKSTKALADFIAKQEIVASATLHTYYPAVVYPWGISTHDLATPYTDIFTMLATAATVETHYAIGNSTEVIYPADGTYEDYAFWKHGVWSLLFELGESHDPSVDDLKKMIDENVPGLRRMLEQAPRTRAEKHEFTGKCDIRLFSLDRHDE